jgi:plasmid stabilization system protein ParE
MHGLLDRLRIGRQQPGPDPLEAAQARIGELTEALRGLIDLSDSGRSRDFAEVKRLLAHARRLLADPSHVAQMSHGEEPRMPAIGPASNGSRRAQVTVAAGPHGGRNPQLATIFSLFGPLWGRSNRAGPMQAENSQEGIYQ